MTWFGQTISNSQMALRTKCFRLFLGRNKNELIGFTTVQKRQQKVKETCLLYAGSYMPPRKHFAQVKCRLGQSIVGTLEVGAFHLFFELTSSVVLDESANILVWF